MRNPIDKRIPRILRKNILKYLGMVLILICTISVGTSFKATMNGALSYLDKIKDENLQEDGFFETVEALPAEALDFFEKEGVAVYENFYATENNYADSAKVLLFNERKNADIPTVFSGRLPESPDEIALDAVFAHTRNLNVNDKITLLGTDYTIVGTVTLPDYTALFMNNTDLVMNTENFCVAVLDSNGFDNIDIKNITYRYSYRYNDRNLSKADKTDIENGMLKQLVSNGYTVETFLTRSRNQSIAFLENDIGKDGPFITVFVYLLVALIAFIFAVLTNGTIEQEAVMIGTLRASGYKKSEIIMHYLKPTLIVAVTGSVIGNILGYTVMIQPFISMYQMMYSIGPLTAEFDAGMLFLTTVLPVTIMTGINLIMMSRKLSLSPLAFLRKELKKGKSAKPVKLPKLGFIGKVRLRTVIQNPGSYIILFIGIFLASFLLMFGIGLKPLTEYYTDNIDASLPYEYQYILKAPLDTYEGEKVSLCELDVFYALGNKDIGIYCYGIDKESSHFSGAHPERGVYIASSTSKKLGLKVGDTISLKDSGTDKTYEFNISGVYSFDATMALFIDKDTLNETLNLDPEYFNCILSDKELDIDRKYIAKQVTRQDLVGAVTQVMDSFDTVIQVINIISVIVYVILLFILTRVVIERNAMSISHMKVFGYTDREINSIFITTTTIAVVLSLLICLPVEALLFKFTLIFLSVMIEGYMPFYLPAWVYITIVAVGLAAYFLINAFNIRSVRKISFSDSLKCRE